MFANTDIRLYLETHALLLQTINQLMVFIIHRVQNQISIMSTFHARGEVVDGIR